MKLKTLTVELEGRALRLLEASSQPKRRAACESLFGYDLSVLIEIALHKAADSDTYVAVRKAARKTLLNHWARRDPKEINRNADAIRAHMATRGISVLYHLTAKTNWESIQSRGEILPKAELKRRNISFTTVASEQRDQLCGTDEWIHLCFHPNQPMFYRQVAKENRGSVVVLDIALDAALCGSVVYSTMNAVAGYARLGPALDDLQRLDLTCFSDQWFTPETKAAWQAEVLIRPSIPTGRVVRVRSYLDVLQAHQANVPMGAKLDFLNRPLGN